MVAADGEFDYGKNCGQDERLSEYPFMKTAFCRDGYVNKVINVYKRNEHGDEPQFRRRKNKIQRNADYVYDKGKDDIRKGKLAEDYAFYGRGREGNFAFGNERSVTQRADRRFAGDV